MKLTTAEVDAIVDIIDPLCRHRYKEGECLPRGYETHTVEKVNEIQGFRERAARSKARKIQSLIEG